MSAPDSAEVACPDDAELAAFVARTLTPERRAAVELHVDACAACRETIAHLAATESDQPRRIGRYRLDRVIGTGGMGVVWQAWDPALERALAIKLLRPETTDDHGRARFVREARALAQLQHPNVVAIHDVGDLDGELFLATELIDGESLDRWQRGRAPAEILAAYAQAARGLAAAHGLGLVHRDVKPSNILVSRDGRVRVGDFGLATRDEASAPTIPQRGGATAREVKLTVDGEVVGTPAYMAPEQRDGAPVDARADQYSLCLALAEALLGEQPPGGATATTLAARGVDAPWPAIAQGLATRPGDRHATLAPLIAALDGGDDAARARTRRRLAVIAGAGAAVAAAAVIAIAVRGGGAATDPAAVCAARRPLAGAWEPANRQAITTAFAATRLPYADDAAREAVGAIDAWATELAAEDRRTCEDAATHRAPPDIIAKREACLASARTEMTELVAGLVASPDPSTIQRAPASARQLTAPASCDTAAGLANQIIAADPATAARNAALLARVTKAGTLRRLGKLADARATAEAALADARTAAYLPGVAAAQEELGAILHVQDDPAAEQTLADALAAAAETHADYRAAAISALLVEVVGKTGDLAAAERQARLARPAIIRAGNDRGLESIVERGLGRTYQAANKWAEAYDHHRRAEDIHVTLGDTDAIDTDRRAEVVALGSQERLDEATKINDQLYASDLANLGPKHPSTITDGFSGAVLMFRTGRFADVATALEQLLPIDIEVSGPDATRVTRIRSVLAAAYLQLGRLDEAEPLFHAVVDALAAHQPVDAFQLRGQQMNLAAVQLLLGHYSAAETGLDAVIVAARAAKDDDTLGLALQNLAEALTRDGKHELAIAAGKEALERDAKVFGATSRRGAEAHGSLGNAYRGLGKLDQAAAEYKLAIHGYETEVGADTAELGEPLTGLAEVTLAKGDAAGARALLDRAVAVLAKGDPVDLARATFALARTLAAQGDRDGATTAAKAAIDLYAGAGTRAEAKKAEVERWVASQH